MDAGRKALVRAPGHGANDRSVSLIETDDGRLLVHCFSPREDWRAIREALAADGLLDARAGAALGAPARAAPPAMPPTVQPAVQPAVESRIARARRFWTEARALPGSAAECYLLRRAIRPPAWNDDVLRCHPAATSLDDRRRRPALIAAIRDSDGELQGVQVTLLTRYGERKAHVTTPRRTIGRGRGGAVQLDPPGDTLIVAEGVETAMSAAEALGHPAWAALTATLLATFDPPAVVRRLIIAADDDEAGRQAAQTLAMRAQTTLSVEIALPGEAFPDWNDRAIAHRAARRG
ncbi:MAG: virulence-associated protein E [Alphaproteobacteria bacterium]|nr:MAG: virulence-associated protein E [Alphaproteobacteria bacterium]